MNFTSKAKIKRWHLRLNSLWNFSKKPCWDVPREGLQHETIENEREFVETLAEQEISKKKAAVQKRFNEKRIEDMYVTQLNLREKFIKVNEFMNECVEKTDRAENQIESELKQQGLLKEQIGEIEHDLNELSSFEAKFKEIIKEFQPYEDVFNEVIETSDTFESFEDLMSKCDALSNDNQVKFWSKSSLLIVLLPVLAQVEIAEREQELIKGIELIRQKMLKSTYEASQKIIELNTQLAELEVSYDYLVTPLLFLSFTLI